MYYLLVITPKTSDDDLAAIRLKNLCVVFYFIKIFYRGFVFQTFNLLPSMTALENVELPLTLLGMSSQERKQKATQLLNSVQIGDRLDHYPSMLRY
jgi:putative ABC transport system ATP-binding protein